MPKIIHKEGRQTISILYYPCIFDNRKARICKKVGPAMSKDEAESFLKKKFTAKWYHLDAIPQPVEFIDKYYPQ